MTAVIGFDRTQPAELVEANAGVSIANDNSEAQVISGSQTPLSGSAAA